MFMHVCMFAEAHLLKAKDISVCQLSPFSLFEIGTCCDSWPVSFWEFSCLGFSSHQDYRCYIT